MRKVLAVLLLLVVTGCSENPGGEISPSTSLSAAFASGEAPSASCLDLLVEWGSLVRADLKDVEPPPSWDLVEKYEAQNRTWSCLPKGASEGRADDRSVIIGLAMMRSDGPGSSLSSSLILFGEEIFSGLAPCAAAWATADLFVSAEEDVGGTNREIQDTTWACFSVDEWWMNLKRFPNVFGVFDYPNSDRWSYLAAVCSADNGSEMCNEARTSGALQP